MYIQLIRFLATIGLISVIMIWSELFNMNRRNNVNK